MEEKFVNYLESIGITQALMPRIEKLITALELISGEEIIDIFISEYMEEDGTRVYEDFRAFSENYHLGALKFLHIDKYIIWDRNKQRLSRMNWEVSKYEFRSLSPDSRASLHCGFLNPGPILLKASQNNCDKLFTIYKEYLVCMLG